MRKNIITGIALLLALSACQDKSGSESSVLDQQQLNEFAAGLKVRYELITNVSDEACKSVFEDDSCFQAQLSLTASKDFAAKGWTIYFSQVRAIKQVSSDEFDLQHINGDLHRITPADAFSGFKAGQAKVIHFRGEAKHLSETDLMPNYYVVADGLESAVIASTQPRIDPETGLEILPYVAELTDEERHFKKSLEDKTVRATAEYLYQQNQDTRFDSAAVAQSIIPTPKQMVLDKEGSTLDLATGIKLNLQNVKQATISGALARLEQLGVTASAKGIPANVSVFKNKDKVDGTYILEIRKDSIDIVAYESSGVSYALQSLASLISVGQTTVPVARIMDEPRYSFRGMHLDVSRNFHSKEMVLKLLDQMAAYKLNKLHLHLADDEGWRLEIKSLPELTDIGSKRCYDPEENTCLMPQLGSGLDTESVVNGYYTIEDYKEILLAANAHHIKVIPSFDMPGHSRAAVKAMEARYRKLMAAGKQAEAEEYLLTDFDDTTVYSSIQNYGDNTINVCMDSAYRFIDTVIEDVLEIHKAAGHPLTRYHIGADETAGAWVESPLCQAFLKDNKEGLKKAEDLGGYYIERVSAILDRKGIMPAAWSDGISHTRPEKMPAVVHANAWSTLSQDGIALTHKLINRGWEVILSHPDVLYFDFPQAADPKERGYYWASRSTTDRKVFSFMPDNLPAHSEIWGDSESKPVEVVDKLQKDDEGKVTYEPLQRGKAVVGIQGQLWSETVRSDAQAEYMIYPRLIALAERAWHRAEWEVPYNYDGTTYNQSTSAFSNKLRQQRDSEWQRFANVVGQRELAKLDLAGITYRIPTVGAKRENGKLHANIAFPGLSIQYRVDAGDWQTYAVPVEVGQSKVEVRALSADGKRKGRILAVN